MADSIKPELSGTIPRHVKSARLSTFFTFLLCGVAVSAWAPMVPLAKQRTSLNEAELGLILLCMGAGAIVSMPFIGPIIQRKGSRTIILLCSILCAAMLPVLTIVDSPILLGASLFIFGSAIGCLDVSMNSQAVVVQDEVKRPIMSAFHGMFSVGGLIGAMLFGLLIYLGLTPFFAALGIALLLIIIAIAYNSSFLDHPSQASSEGFRFTFPKGPVVMLGIFCFIAFLAEGALLDWSALFLREYQNFGVSLAGAGFATFSVSMSVMRLTGDSLVQRFGPGRMVFWGAFLAAAGILLAVFTTSVALSMSGFLLVGIGAANIVPVLFSAAGNSGSYSPELALAAVTTMGYAGQLAGPALIGFIAQWLTLPVALGILAAPLIFIGVGFSGRKKVASVDA